MNKCALFIMSCDYTADVAGYFFKGLDKYWSDCPLLKLVGTNEGKNITDLTVVPLPVQASNWKQETIDQIRLIKKQYPEITHLLVFLDDFILSNEVETQRVKLLAKDVVEQKVSYLRCRPLEESIWGKIIQRMQSQTFFGEESCFIVRKNHPYYSALQVAFWDIEYLYEMVNDAEGIWAFENMVHPEKKHWSVSRPVFQYRHIVEKGEWDIGAEEYCKKYLGDFSSGSRQHIKKPISKGYWFWNKLKFHIFGYSIMRLKRKLRK